MQSNIAVTNKHTAKLHRVGSIYIYIYLTSEFEGKIHCLGWKVLYSVQRCGFLEVWVLYISDLKHMVIVLVTVMVVVVVVDVLIVNWWRGCDKCNYFPLLVSRKW
jgi:hypothetical protein